MLVLSPNRGERIAIGDDIEVTVVDVHGDRVSLGFRCPDQIPVHRAEVYRKVPDKQLAGTPIELFEQEQKCVDLG